MSMHQNKHGENVNMEISKLNFIQDGAIKLPPGFRFQPTDQEIVFQYLIRKAFSCPLPASIVPEITNICKFNPRDLPGDLEQDRYFFSKNEAKYGHGSTRPSDGGYWKEIGFDKPITRCCNNNLQLITTKKEIIMGMKKTLVFYKGLPMNRASSTRTCWIMHEYRLVHTTYNSPDTSSNDKRCWMQMGNWVVCHILLNKSRKATSSGLEVGHHGFMMRNDDQMNVQHEPQTTSSSSSSSSCGSSVVTEEVSSSRKL